MFGRKRHDDDDIEDLAFLSVISDLVKIVDKLTVPAKLKPILTLSTIINNKTFIMSDISLTLGGKPQSGVFTLLNANDGSINPSASFSNQAVGANSNPEFATFALDASNNVVPTPVAVGAGTVVFSAHADYTDNVDGSAQSQDFTVTKNFTVVAGTGPGGASLDVVFS
jgi:hypothetical protein